MSSFFRVAAGVALVSIGGVAHASICESIMLSLASDPTLFESFSSSAPECFPSATAGTVNQQSISATTVQQALMVSNAVSSRFNAAKLPADVNLAGLGSGMAAGNTGKWFVWGNVGLNTANYHGGSGANPRINSSMDVMNSTVGADYALSPNMALGLSVAFDEGDGDLTNLNSFGGPSTNALDTSGTTFAPYFGWQISPELTVDASAGWGWGKQDQLGSKTDSDRLFGAANLTFTRWFDKLQFTAKGGYLHAEEKYGNIKAVGVSVPGTSTKARLDQVRLGVQLAYWVQGGVMPYVGVAYANDVDRTSTDNQPWDRDAFVWTAGVNAFSIKEGVTGGVAYTREAGRTGSANDTLNISVNVRF